MSLTKISKDGVDLAVEERQLPAYLEKGWEFTPAKRPKPAPVNERPAPSLIDVWRGDELRRCTIDQLKFMATLGFTAKERDNGRREGISGGNSGQLEGLREQPGSDEPRQVEPGLGDGSIGSGSSSSVGLAGYPGSGSEAEPGLDNEQAPGRVIERPSTDDEIRAAFAQLDPANDDHWTKMGAPRLEVLNTFLAQGPANRPQVNAATDNAVRPTV